MGYGLGVDLGTSFTGVAIGRYGRTRIVPLSDDPISTSSFVATRPAGALPSREVDDTVPVVLGGRPYPAVAVLAEALRSVLESVTAAEGEAPEQVVLTCPAVWGPARRQQFGEVSRRAGLTSVTVVSEPEAAVTAMVDGRRLAEDDVVVVYDLGGVTVDMTVVRVTDSGMEILGLPEGAEGAGGADFDDLLLAHVDRAVGGALSQLDLSDPVAVGVLTGVRAECVRAKEALSRTEVATVRVVGLAAETPPVLVTRTELETLIRRPLTSTLVGLSRVLDTAGVPAADLTAVVLVGGSSRIPLVSQMLGDTLGRPVLMDEHPQHCVALGAAAIADDTSIADGALRITPGAPPITNSLPTIAAAKLAQSTSTSTQVAQREGRRPVPAPDATQPGLSTPAADLSRTGDYSQYSQFGQSSASHQIDLNQAGPNQIELNQIDLNELNQFEPIGPGATAVLAVPLAPSTVPMAPVPAVIGSVVPQSAVLPSPAELAAVAATFPGTGEAPVDVTSPSLSRRAGGHRMPRMGDWSRRAGIERHGVEDRRWRVVAVAALTVLLIGGGTYAFSPVLKDSSSDTAASTQIVDSSVSPEPSTPAASTSASASPTASATPTPSATTAKPTATPTRAATVPATTRPPITAVPTRGQTRRSAPARTVPPTQPAPIVAPVTGTGALVGLDGRCLDVANGLDADGTAIQLFNCNGSGAQVWTAGADSTLQARGKCLQVTGGAGSRVQISGCNGNAAQEWVVVSGAIKNPASTNCLEVQGANPADGTPVVTAACNGSGSQTWSLR